MEYRLCEKWGCTPSQLGEENPRKVDLAFRFMSAEGEASEMARKDAEKQ
jgi:hypothetical protein